MIPSRSACFVGGAASALIFLMFGMWALAALAFVTGCVAAQFVPPPGLDPVRFFSTDDRRIIYDRVNGICENPKCGKLTHFESDCPQGECPLDFQADHKYPHSRGGRTVLSNGACLCRGCNGRKGARI